MPPKDDSTASQDPVQTGDGNTPPAATAPQGSDAATTSEESITLPKKDYNNLLSSRDSNFNNAAEAAAALEQQSAFIEQLAAKEGINQFLNDHKSDYPDLTYDDLKHIDSPEALEAEAQRLQRRLEDHAQNKILAIENPKAPSLSPEQRAAKMAELKKNGDLDGYMALQFGL